MKWNFYPPLGMKVDLISDSHFTDQALSDPAKCIVREDSQNRNDQRSNKDQPVIVRYHFPDDPITPEASEHWFGSLAPHLNSQQVSEKVLRGRSSFSERSKLQYAVIECFNTTGIRGDPERFDDPPYGEEGHEFYWFFRNEVRSGKVNKQGSHGVGKVVYAASSLIRSYLVYSVEEDNLNEILIGKSVLCNHSFDNGQYMPFGTGGVAKNQKKEDPLWISPITDPDELERFRKDFEIDRSKKAPGTSIIVADLDPEINFESTFNAIVTQFFYSMLQNDISYVISSGTGEQILLDNDTLMNEVNSWRGFEEEDKENLRARLTFCQQVDKIPLKGKSAHFHELSLPTRGKGGYGTPQLDEMFSDEDALAEARETFTKGDPIAFELPVKIEELQTGQSETDSFLVYLQKVDDIRVRDEMFIRQGLSIIGERNLKVNGVRALTLILNDPLSQFLGNAENPTHTEWLKNELAFAGKYKAGPTILSYVKSAANRLAGLLSRLDSADEGQLLESFFSIKKDADGSGTPQSIKRGKKKRTKPRLKKIRKVDLLEKTPLHSARGIRVNPVDKTAKPPKEVVILSAYGSEGSDPFLAYNPADFDLSDPSISIKISGGRRKRVERNKLVVTVNNPDFQIEITGFPGTRDLAFRAIPES